MRPKGSLLAGAVNIANLKAATPRTQHTLQAEVKPLTQEDLERYWRQAASELGLEELMQAANPRLGDTQRIIEIDATQTYFHDDFKPHRIAVMESLRRQSGMPMLDCRVNPLYVDSERLLYSPQEKYDAMLQQNPKLVELRKLFPQIEL